jgi:TonB family protein
MRKTSRIYFLISIAIHLLFVLAWVTVEVVVTPERPDRRVEKPLKDFAFEVVETPDYAPEEEPDSPTDLVSDKSTRAADTDPGFVESADLPYAEGEFDLEQYPRPDVGSEGTSAPAPSRQEMEGELGEVLAAGENPGAGVTAADQIDFKSLISRLSNEGGMSFNTYEWDFAPYMLAMKRKVESNIHPPYAFTHMGLVSGTNVVRFTVSREGKVVDLTILGSDTHFSLDRTSVRAIELASPFLPLPESFPLDVLEVTAEFSYIVR